ncbi:DUF2231 domain-containing protein [Aldersonia kunmingensis]|uniref:DUF2231 domain-containing protein n=1 Tax=Aldersonia kunmingensis TaxID=408066 RepID=UPI000831008B|nr:DUF2231 domain-containing protein [Aldersonia kunmingensis]
MSTINDLPAHVLLVHFVVVLIPVTVVLEIALVLWRQLRDLLWWVPIVLSAGLVVLVRYTEDAGEWFNDYLGNPPFVRDHAELGETAIWIAIALLVVALAIAVLHWRERKANAAALTVVVAVLTIVVGVLGCVQLYRIGDSGSKAVWGDVVKSAPAVDNTPGPMESALL